MSRLGDDWDADEREAFNGFEVELAEIRRRYRHHPSLAMLRAATVGALPAELQEHVEWHLQSSAWTRAIVAGLMDTGSDSRLDAEAIERLWRRIVEPGRLRIQ